VSGGCKLPHSPHKRVTCIGLEKMESIGSIELPEGLVAHDSVYDPINNCLYVIGGANGSGFNQFIYQIKEGGEINKI
jgi:hypothetical protein